MNIKLHQIGDRSTDFEFRLSNSDLPKLEKRFKFDSMICKAELARSQDSIRLRGAYTVDIESSCDHCLDPVVIKMDRQFDLILVNEEDYAVPEGDVEISLRSEDVDFYNGQDIPLSGFFEDQLLLDLPFSVKCDEDCEGICPECGVNRNHDTCQCTEKTGNNPFSVLGNLEE